MRDLSENKEYDLQLAELSCDEIDSMREAMCSAIDSNDGVAVANASIKYPVLYNSFHLLDGFTSKRQDDIARATYEDIMRDPNQGREHLAIGIKTMDSYGFLTGSMIGLQILMDQDYTEAILKIEMMYAMLYPREYLARDEQTKQKTN